MSATIGSAVLSGLVMATAGVCLAAARQGQKAVKAFIREVNWLSEAAKRELEKLEHALDEEKSATSEECLSTSQARREYQNLVKRARKLAAKNPLLNQKREAVVQFLALHKSRLGQFIPMDQLQTLEATHYRTTFTDRALKHAVQGYADATRQALTVSIKQAAEEMSYGRVESEKDDQGQHFLTIGNDQMQGLVAKISLDKRLDVKTDLDFYGYSDHECGQKMSELLEKLRQRNIRIEGGKRDDHGQTLGILLPRKKSRRSKQRSQAQSTPARRTRPKVRTS